MALYTIDNDSLLESLAEATGRDNKAEVIRDALAAYGYIYKRVINGEHLYIGKDRDKAVEVVFTTFEHG